MAKVMDKLKDKVKYNKRLVVFLIGISLIGIICGSIFITIISKTDQTLVKTYIEEFMSNVGNNKLNYFDAIKNTLIGNGSYVLIIWLLGISIIGIPIIVFLYFTKTFMLGFSISAFILTYKTKGLLYALLYIFPHHIINLVAYTLLMVYAIKFSLYLLNSIIKKKSINFKNIMNQYLIIFGIVIILIILSALLETFLAPFLLEKFVFLIK